MEIEFNPSRVGQPESAPPVVRSGTAHVSRAEAPFPDTDAVEAKLKDIPLARPEKVQHDVF